MTATSDDPLDSLVVPPAFSRYDGITDPVVLTDLQQWRSESFSTLSRLGISPSSMAEQAKVVRVLAPLTAIAPWTSPKSRSLASALLATVSPTPALVTYTLSNVVKPLFTATPHPRLHTETGRVLARPADTQDTYHHQPWKDHPGLDEVIRWCVSNTQPTAYQRIWPLVLPPVMTFLDDYQIPFKILGARLVSDILTRVPPELLLRTGIDALLFTSLSNALNHLRDPSTPVLIRTVVPTTLQLIDFTTPSSNFNAPRIEEEDKSESRLKRVEKDVKASEIDPTGLPVSLSLTTSLCTRFTRLSNLLSSSILGTVIMYTPTLVPSDPTPAQNLPPDPEDITSGFESVNVHLLQTAKPDALHPTLVAAGQVLPSVLSALGIGSARFLKGVVPVVAGWLALPIPTLPSWRSDRFSNGGVPMDNGPDREKQLGHIGVEDDAPALHLAALHVIRILCDTCAPCMDLWATTIIDGLARCWVGCIDAERADAEPSGLEALRKSLREVALELASVCPSVVKDEYACLMAFDETLFGGLVGNVQSPVGSSPEL